MGCWRYSVILERALFGGERGVWLPNPLGPVFTGKRLRKSVTAGGSGSPEWRGGRILDFCKFVELR